MTRRIVVRISREQTRIDVVAAIHSATTALVEIDVVATREGDHAAMCLADVLRSPTVTLLFVEVDDVRALEELAALNTHTTGTKLGRCAVIAIVRPCRADAQMVRLAIRSGVSDLLLLGVDNVADVLARNSELNDRVAGWHVNEVTHRVVDHHVLPLINLFLTHAVRGNTLQELCSDARMSPRSMARLCTRYALPPPGKILRRLRVLLTLEDVHRGGQHWHLAHKHGYTSLRSFRRALRDITGMAPTMASTREGLHQVLTAFELFIQQGRTPHVATEGRNSTERPPKRR